MFHIVVWLAVGAIIGGVASLLMRASGERGVFVNVMLGVVGAMAGAWVVAPLFGLRPGDPKVMDFSALSVALIGAVLTLAAVSMLRGRR